MDDFQQGLDGEMLLEIWRQIQRNRAARVRSDCQSTLNENLP